MKIVYVYPQFAHRAGTERILIDKMNYLAESGNHDIIMLTHEQGNHPIAYPLSSKVKHVDLDVRFFPLFRYNRLTRVFKWKQHERLLQLRFNVFMQENRPDIVIAATYYVGILSLITKCPVRTIRVLESHIDLRFILSNDPANRKSIFRWLHMIYDMKSLVKNSQQFDVLVALSCQDAKDWSKHLKSIVIPNVVHLNPTGHFSSLENKNVIFVGRYMEQKGIPDLLKVWELVHKRHSDWHLDLYGEGDLKSIIEVEAQRLQANIHVHQPDAQIFSRYMESSILVLTSVYEPFGLVIPEAMSCGLPIVSFDCPSGPADIITDGVNGYLIQDRDIHEFANKVCMLIESTELRVKMGKAAIVSAQRYMADAVMPLWEDLFSKLYIQHQNQKKDG